MAVKTVVVQEFRNSLLHQAMDFSFFMIKGAMLPWQL
jgi:hypothetical protein